jgi:hypothetical protein
MSEIIMDSWPFSDPPNVAAISVKQIFRSNEPILLVVHDEDDGGWQFLTGGPFSVSDGLVVALKNVVALDSSVCELADLPIGWQAFRPAHGQPWVRARSQHFSE